MKEPEYLQNEKIRVLDPAGNRELDPQTVDWNSPEAQEAQVPPGSRGRRTRSGLVRIDMPNEHTVYMHDTPMKPLFKQRSRAFSAGCVRVEGVFDLVDWLAQLRAGLERAGPRAVDRRGGAGRRRQPDASACRCTSSTSPPGPSVTATSSSGPTSTAATAAVDQIAEMDRDPNEPAPAVTLAP